MKWVQRINANEFESEWNGMQFTAWGWSWLWSESFSRDVAAPGVWSSWHDPWSEWFK